MNSWKISDFRACKMEGYTMQFGVAIFLVNWTKQLVGAHPLTFSNPLPVNFRLYFVARQSIRFN